MGRLQGKVAIVTGGGSGQCQKSHNILNRLTWFESGFGEGIVKGFVVEGANVIIADVSVAGGQRVEKEVQESDTPNKGSAVFLEFDCTKKDHWERGLAFAKEKFGKLDIVVNNAGTTYHKKPSGTNRGISMLKDWV